MNYECNKCGSIDFFTEPRGCNIGLFCSMCGKWKKWLGKDEALAFQHNQAGKKQKLLIKRIIKVTAIYDIDETNLIDLQINPKESIKDILKKGMKDYFGYDESHFDVKVEVIDEEEENINVRIKTNR